MDTIGRIRTAIFGNTEQKENSADKSSKNLLHSHATRSSAHVNRAIDEGQQVNIKLAESANARLSADSAEKKGCTASSSKAETSPNPSTLPSSHQGGSTHIPTAKMPADSSARSSSGMPVKFTPSKRVNFSDDIQGMFYDKLRPEGKSLANQYNLTKTEAAAIYAYTRDEFYRDMNAALRAVNKDGNVDASSAAALKHAGITDDGLAEMIAATVSGMKKLPPDQTDTSVFIALGRNDSVPEEFLEPYAQGASITMGPFYSSTVSMPTVEGWWDGSDHFLSVLQNVNGNGRDISAFSEFPNEKEVLFMPGTRFMVLGRTERTETPVGTPGILSSFRTKTKILLQLQEVSSNPNDALPPSIHPSTFQSLAAPVKEKKPEKSDSFRSETKSTYFGIK